jgi:hypothetical protein
MQQFLRKNGLRYGTTNHPLSARTKYETLHDTALQKTKKQVHCTQKKFNSEENIRQDSPKEQHITSKNKLKIFLTEQCKILPSQANNYQYSLGPRR